MVRVAKPGGRVLIVAYGSPDGFEALQLFVRALKSVSPEFPGVPDDPPPLEFQLADPEVLRSTLARVGLEDVQVVTHVEERLEFGSGQDCWNWLANSNPIVSMIAGGVAPSDHSRLVVVLDQLLQERAGAEGPAMLTSRLNIGWGTKPGAA
jgi:hypothetical protein